MLFCLNRLTVDPASRFKMFRSPFLSLENAAIKLLSAKLVWFYLNWVKPNIDPCGANNR